MELEDRELPFLQLEVVELLIIEFDTIVIFDIEVADSEILVFVVMSILGLAIVRFTITAHGGTSDGRSLLRLLCDSPLPAISTRSQTGTMSQ